MKKLRVIALTALLLLVVIQFYRPRVNDQKATVDMPGLPDSVRQILQKACYDCHSDSTRLSWFDQPAPIYWIVGGHVRDGKAALNFADWNSMSADTRKAVLFESLNQVEYKTMPLSDYLLLHGAATPSARDIAVLRNYLATFEATIKFTPTPGSLNPDIPAFPHPDHPVAAEPTGFNFLPDCKDWSPISATERFDNGTLRLILGNEIARNAIRAGQTNPWPDGSAFAKIAWKQALDSSGRIHPGLFVQVELMVRDSKKYAPTYNWGWGRWRGPDLTPYGANAEFVGECMRCHLPMKANDFVFTIPVNSGLQGKGIATLVDGRRRTISILCQKDSLLSLTTWKERDDPHWFGGRIPAAQAATVELVRP